MGLTCELGQHVSAAAKPADFIRIRASNGFLDISLRRTIRVADNDGAMFLPPDLGPYPLHSVGQYKSLPSVMKERGGLFFPIGDLEAMAMLLRSTAPFAVRVSVGGINALTGTKTDDSNGWLEVKGQAWLDGFVVSASLVRQFVAIYAGSNPSASYEAQKTGSDADRTISIEVMPRFTRFLYTQGERFLIYVRTLTGNIHELQVHSGYTVLDLKEMLDREIGVPVDDQHLIYAGMRLEDATQISTYNIALGSTLSMVLRLRGGYIPPLHERENLHLMSVAPGGLIRQRPHHAPKPEALWDHEHTISFNVNLINTLRYEKITGLPPAHPAISEAEYSASKLSYFRTENALAAQFGLPGGTQENLDMLADKIRSICNIRDIKESSHPMEVVTLERTGPRSSRYSPFAEMLVRARQLNYDATVESKPVVEWWGHSSPAGNGQTFGGAGVVAGTAAVASASGQSNGAFTDKVNKLLRKQRRPNRGDSKCIVM
ncbi:hypothetical protein LTR66_014439 [Elasticomyces elasticus]|nr:hypothetical protein LTR66_014439 [Elasticomyces elasticus]KAK4964657.1 hypothetical protein LTR28_003629 [Elasticomyces elasticus]